VASRQIFAMLAIVGLAVAGARPGLAGPLDGGGDFADTERLRPGIYPAAPVPPDFAVPGEPGHNPLDIDWSVGLRGSFTHATTGDSFVTTLTPQASGTYEGRRGTLAFEGSAAIARVDGSNELALGSAAFAVDGRLALDRLTTLTGRAALEHARTLPGTPGLDPLLLQPAGESAGTLELGVERRFGQFKLGAEGSLARRLYGDSVRADTGTTSNADQDHWSTAARLRLGYQMTPIFEVFGEAGLGREMFDHPNTRLGQRLDATDRTVRAGVSGNWNDVLSASVSVGVGERQFDAAGLDRVTTQLYDASVTFRPTSTLALTAGLASAIAPPGSDGAGTAKIEHSAEAGVDYDVNSWLRLRASADWTASRQVGGPETETRYGLGAGADYRVNRHTELSADYDYGHRDNSSSGTLDSHTISVGITLRR